MAIGGVECLDTQTMEWSAQVPLTENEVSIQAIATNDDGVQTVQTVIVRP